MSEADTMKELELTLNRRFAASRERVFKAWLDPRTLAKFMKPTDLENLDAVVSTDPVTGGRFSILMKMPDSDIPHEGTYLEINPYSRLQFTWESANSLDDSVVTIDLVEVDAHTTDLTLHQIKFKNESKRDGHIMGWNRMLDVLTRVLG
jgi:uncharacterized protein YndB with AHSA1/START domain